MNDESGRKLEYLKSYLGGKGFWFEDLGELGDSEESRGKVIGIRDIKDVSGLAACILVRPNGSLFIGNYHVKYTMPNRDLEISSKAYWRLGEILEMGSDFFKKGPHGLDLLSGTIFSG